MQYLIVWSVLHWTLYHAALSCNPVGCQNYACGTDSKCMYGCITGYSGERCDTCVAGYYIYWLNANMYCYSCPVVCLNNDCNVNDGTCTQGCINNRYYGESCTPCSNGCNSGQCNANGNCSCINGYTGSKCDSCIYGWYKSGAVCTPCSNGCDSGQCYADGTCSCQSGYTGLKCDSCVSGWYKSGTVCITCSNGCLNGNCHANDGTCSCKLGYTGQKCENCQTGFYKFYGNCCPNKCTSCTDSDSCQSCTSGQYGNTCNVPCSTGCYTNLCAINGVCNDGCKSGFYGQSCVQCSPGCADKCNSDDGQCMCQEGYSGTKCDQCVEGWFKVGTECQMCPQNCSSCTSRTDCTTCLSGYYGSVCESTCSPGCYNNGCYKSNGLCNTCKDGFSGDKCCVQNEGCHRCSTNDVCSVCKRGFYGAICEFTCPTNCDGNCDRDTGECNGCINSHFGPFCNQLCSNNCLVCLANGNCTVCKHGYYGNKCENTCPDNCIKCTSDSQCSECKDRYFGQACGTKCPENCVSCTSTNYCTACKDGFRSTYRCNSKCTTNCKSCLIGRSDRCTICNRGRYANNWHTSGSHEYSYCNSICPKYCVQGMCNERTGECTHGCVDGYTGTKCCLDNCRPDQCNTHNGNCYSSRYCKTGYSGSTCNCHTDGCTDSLCTSCTDNTWYWSSNRCCKCSTTCRNNVCTDNGVCSEGCIDGFYGNNCMSRCMDMDINCLICERDNCTKCLVGYYPDQSSRKCITCSEQCLNNNCSSIDGKCIEGCRQGFWGEHCQFMCEEHCLECDRTSGICNVCEEHRYKRNCSGQCTDDCLKQLGSSTCNIDTGACNLGCSTTIKYGEYCSIDCSNKCFNSECNWKTGTCTNGCIANHYGQKCETPCNNACVTKYNDSRCDHKDGSCRFGCEIGHYGDRCDDECGSNCANRSCTRTNGECEQGCTDGFSGTFCAQAIQQEDPVNTGMIAGASAGAALFLIIIAVVLVIIFVFRRRKRNRKDDIDFSSSKQNLGSPTNDETGPAYNNTSASINLNVNGTDGQKSKATEIANPIYQNHDLPLSLHLGRLSESDTDLPEVVETPLKEAAAPSGDTYYNAGAITRTRVTVDKLAEYVNGRTRDDLVDEFKKLPKELYKPYADSQKAANVKRNRYKGIYPYDFNRVKLEVPKGKSDYINASYIDGFRKEKEYIAALGPTDPTTEKFATIWRMLWQQNVEKIVMLTNLIEDTKMKCHQYWPDPSTNKVYGEVDVRCLSEEVYAEFTVRTFSLSKGSEKRVMNHFHYTAWPDRGVPSDVTGLLEFRNKVQSINSKQDGPVVVHCSAGVGRTGTYIALDYLTKEGEQTQSVDVFECVTNLRAQRVYMVQAEEQYVYIHDAIVHSLTFESKPIPSDRFDGYVKTLAAEKLKQKFQMLQSCQERPQQEETEAIKRNKAFKNKNHPKADIPGDRYRVRLHLSQEFGVPNYINAVYIDAYREKNRYVVSQSPLESTVNDFLTLLFQEHFPCLVDMDQGQSMDNGPMQYIPADNQTISHGDFEIVSNKMKSAANYIERELTITWNKKSSPEQRTCSHYQYTAWDPKTNVPSSPSDFVAFVQMVESKAKEQFSDGKVIVHCTTGAERSCLFCAVSVMLQKMETEQQVSVVNVVRQIKSRRSNAVPNKEQYLFCHQCISVFLESFNTYSNFL